MFCCPLWVPELLACGPTNVKFETSAGESEIANANSRTALPHNAEPLAVANGC
jgi:hypothetical protein